MVGVAILHPLTHFVRGSAMISATLQYTKPSIMISEIRIISSMATRRLLADLIATFAASSAQPVSVESVGGVDAAKRVAAGEPFDIVVLASEALRRLTDQGHIVAGSCVDLVKSPVAVAVRAGALRPVVASEADVRRAVLAAGSIGYSTGPSGDHLVGLFGRWGILDALKDRVVQLPSGVPVATLVARGDVELGFQQLSELMHADGVDVVGLLPESIQNVTTFSGGQARTSTQPEPVSALLTFLASPAVADIKRRHGMAPP
jgi:molybdate transport system substrate-binding protein